MFYMSSGRYFLCDVALQHGKKRGCLQKTRSSIKHDIQICMLALTITIYYKGQMESLPHKDPKTIHVEEQLNCDYGTLYILDT